MDAPADPRAGWRLPSPGAMPRTAQLEPQVTRVLAPNPSGMTLDGTNTYLVGGPDRALLRTRSGAHGGPHRGARLLPGPPGLARGAVAGRARRRGRHGRRGR